MLFALLLLTSSAAPVLAEDSPAPPPAAIEATTTLPDAEDIGQGIAAAEAEEVEREKELKGPVAAEERQLSRSAFGELSAEEAKELLGTAFAGELSELDSDPARFLSDAEIIRVLGPSVAAVSDEGDKSLLDAGLPVRIENEAGDLQKVDLSLVAEPDGFEPVNPITDLSIPFVAAAPVVFGDTGIGISMVGADGDRSGQRLGDENIFYPEALGSDNDTDLLISPIAAGVEVFNQLRSAESPEILRFRLTLPPGAELRSDGNGGAEVVREEERLAAVPFPHAVDAQGSSFPVELQVEGETIVLHVAHRGADVAYPILVDPAITEDYYNYNWFNGHNHQALTNGAWQYTESHSWIESSTYCIYACWGVGRGLFVSMPSGTHWRQQYGHWSYTRPHANSFLANAWANPFYRHDHGCSRSSYPEPHDYVGMWHNNQWNRFLDNMAIGYGYADIQSWGSTFIVGLSTGGGTGTFNIPCWRDLALGGAAIWLDDWERPTLTATAADVWMDTSAVRQNVSASDPGLGVKSFAATATNTSGASQTWWTNHSCTGLYGSPCPSTWNLGSASEPILNFNPASLPEGVRKLKVEAYDVTQKPSYTMGEMDVRIDHAAPAVSLSGTVTEQATLGTERPAYTFRAEAKDGVPGSEKPEDIRSGATGLVFKNDGQIVSEYKPGCPTQSCAVFREIEVPAASLSPGTHTLSVTATDKFGHTSPPKEFTYSTGDSHAPELSVTGLPAESTSMPTYATYWSAFGVAGAGNGQFNHPADVAVDSSGNVWVVDEYSNRLQKFNEAGEFLAKFGSSGSGDGQLTSPTALALDAKGNIWVTDAGNGRVQQFNARGEFLAKFGAKGTANGQFAGSGPEGIAIDAKGNVWVSDTQGGRIQKFNEKGEFLQAVSSKGSGIGQLGEPAGIDFSPNGDIWVADRQNNRVSVFNEAGEFVRQFGSPGAGEGEFARPDAIAVGQQGDVWIGDQDNGRVQEFNLAGEYVGQLGSQGSGDGQFSFSHPMGLATDSKGSLWIADTNNDRVQRWLIPNVTVSGYMEPLAASATDGGFGVTALAIELTDQGQSTEVVAEETQSCSEGACPLDLNLEEFDLTEKPSGPYVLTVSARDAAGNVRNVSRVVNLDAAPPEISLDGTLAESAGQPLSASSADLQIGASEPDPASGGVERINVERDGEMVASFVSDCSSDCHDVEAAYLYRPVEDGAERAIRPVAQANEGAVGELRRVSCSAADDCWAVGRTKYTIAEQTEGKTPIPLLERWSGTQWVATAVPKPEGATNVFLEGISCSSSTACLAVGYYNNGSVNRPLSEVWDGSKWTASSPPLPGGASRASMSGVSCSAANQCWAYGKTEVTVAEMQEGKTAGSFLWRWNGTEWQATAAPKPAGAGSVLLEGISCASATACLAVGYSGGSASLPLIEHWNGTQWAASSPPLPSGASKGSLHGVSCSSASSCWAYGKTQVTVAEMGEGKVATAFLERWEGSGWQAGSVPKVPLGTGVTVTGVSCASDVACTAIGRYTNIESETVPLTFTWAAGEWRFQPLPQPTESTTASLEGVSCTGANQCATVGYSRIGSGGWSVLAEIEALGQDSHSITAEAVDAQGNASSKTIEVDVPEREFETPDCDPEATSLQAKGVLTASQAANALEESLPGVLAPSEGIVQDTTEFEIDPSYTEPQPNLASEGVLAESETLVSPEGGLALADIACIVPKQSTAAATDATVVNQDAALFANTAPETDTVVRPSAAGATVVQSLRGPEAPTSFSWRITVKPGQELVELPSGAVAIVQDPPEGGVGETAEPTAPVEAETEKILTDAGLQMENAEYELAQAQTETTKEVVAVIAQPWVVLSEGVTVPAKIEIAPVVHVPIEWEAEVTLPQAMIEAEVWPVGLAVEFLSSFAANGHCAPGTSPCGRPDLDRAARYAVYWGNEAHHFARNPYYHDYRSDDCTSFISQILRAAGARFMRYKVSGDGSWWYYNYSSGMFYPPDSGYDDTESWKQADVLPRHLWRFGLVHIDKNQPWAWTKGTIVAADWFGTNSKGDINHLLFVVGQRHVAGNREPLLANHSTFSYPHKPWAAVKERIEDDHGSNWTRFGLALKHTKANLNEKKHAPQNLYGPGGLFNG